MDSVAFLESRVGRHARPEPARSLRASRLVGDVCHGSDRGGSGSPRSMALPLLAYSSGTSLRWGREGRAVIRAVTLAPLQTWQRDGHKFSSPLRASLPSWAKWHSHTCHPVSQRNGDSPLTYEQYMRPQRLTAPADQGHQGLGSTRTARLD